MNVFGPQPGQVLGLQLSGVDDTCGCCCCGCCGIYPNVAKIPQQYAITVEAQHCLSLQEINNFIDEVNHVLEATHAPMFPMIFLHFIIPFSPICIMSSMASSRHKKLTKLIEDKNRELMGRNCHWELKSDIFGVQGRRNARVVAIFNQPLVVLIRHDLMNVQQTPSMAYPAPYAVNMQPGTYPQTTAVNSYTQVPTAHVLVSHPQQPAINGPYQPVPSAPTAPQTFSITSYEKR